MYINIKNERSEELHKGRIGLFFEDINYGLDGGLYAEMIENRSFEFVEVAGTKDHYKIKFDGLYGWESYPKSSSGAKLKIRDQNPLNQINPHYLEFTASQEQRGFTNKAYDGICLKKGLCYDVSFYARAKDYQGQIEVLIEKDKKILASSVIAETVSDKWVRYQAKITGKEDCSYASVVIRLTCPGTVCFDFISMMPSDAVLGLFRRDLAELLKDMKPGFLRFPGGCVVEGNNLDNRYQWKKSVGKVEERKVNWNRWATYNNDEEHLISRYSHYNQSLGIGYYEYFLLCEYLEAKPIPVINVGVSCQYQSSEIVPVSEPAFQEYIDDALDLIEFANGPIDSPWGRLRMRMGHPEPFRLDMLGIGNEQWETDKVDFYQRYEIFEREIHRKYPEIRLIGSSGPDVISEKYTSAWKHYKSINKKNYVYAVDEHYYMEPDWFCRNSHFYDNYSRNIKVFAGEYAAHLGWDMNRPELNTWGAALSEAAFLTGVERNADLVVMACYAPLFARLGYTQWSTDMIWFNGESCYGSPSYYVQKLYSVHQGTHLLTVEHDQEEIPYCVSYDSGEKAIIIKLVNITDHKVSICFETQFALQEYGDVYYMIGKEMDINTVEEPCNIAIRKKSICTSKRMEYILEEKSFHVIKLFGKEDDISET